MSAPVSYTYTLIAGFNWQVVCFISIVTFCTCTRFGVCVYVVSVRACSALQRFLSLSAVHSLQIISSCVITGSLAEFRICLSGGLQLSLSLGRNIDAPFGRRFHPKLFTGPLLAFLAWPVPVGVSPLTEAVLTSFSTMRDTKPACVPLYPPHSSCHTPNLLSGNLAHRNKQPSGPAPPLILN